MMHLHANAHAHSYDHTFAGPAHTMSDYYPTDVVTSTALGRTKRLNNDNSTTKIPCTHATMHTCCVACMHDYIAAAAAAWPACLHGFTAAAAVREDHMKACPPSTTPPQDKGAHPA